MDRTVLIEYADMKEEIKDLRRRIDKDEQKLNKLQSTIVMDSVACGKKGKKPLRTVRITGFPKMETEQRKALLERRIAKLTMLETDLLEKQNEVEEYIEEIEKSELRIMFRLYFLDNLSFPKVAIQMNCMFPKREIKYTDENIKKRMQRYFDNVPLCPDVKW